MDWTNINTRIMIKYYKAELTSFVFLYMSGYGFNIVDVKTTPFVLIHDILAHVFVLPSCTLSHINVYEALYPCTIACICEANIFYIFNFTLFLQRKGTGLVMSTQDFWVFLSELFKK